MGNSARVELCRRLHYGTHWTDSFGGATKHGARLCNHMCMERVEDNPDASLHGSVTIGWSVACARLVRMLLAVLSRAKSGDQAEVGIFRA